MERGLRPSWLLTLVSAALFVMASTTPLFGSRASHIVVAIRYLQIHGASHAHLFLFTENGKLIRQLTREKAGQDHDPAFSSDGTEIAFQRDTAKGGEFWLIKRDGSGARRLEEPPAWYPDAGKDLSYFGVRSSAPSVYNPTAWAPLPSGPDGPLRYTAPDGSVELVLEHPPNKEDLHDWEKRGSTFRLRDLKDGSEVILGTLPGFEGLWDPLHQQRRKVGGDNAPFLIEPPLRAVFFYKHQNSTDGDAVYAVDLSRKRIVLLSRNWAMAVPVPGRSIFFTVTSQRYRPLGDGKRTVNCSYLDRWDAEFNKTRFGRDVPAVFYGASIQRSDNSPLTVRWKIPD